MFIKVCRSYIFVLIGIDVSDVCVQGKLSEAWAAVTKGAVAENILNLTLLGEGQREPSACLHTATLWLALGSLCVLDREHVRQLSSGQWGEPPSGPGTAPPAAPPRPTCSNHDDGETSAIIQCNVCGNLCADCDRFLHLHRKTRMHQRQVGAPTLFLDAQYIISGALRISVVKLTFY